MRLAYADPPYLNCCALYGHEHNETGTRPFDGRCWNEPETHRLLIEWLNDEYPDGWALSASSPSMLVLAPMLPGDTRTAPWFKSFSAFKKGVRPAYAWEPVFFRGGRNPTWGHPHAPPERGGKQNTPKDFFEAHEPEGLVCPITLKKGLTGAKPEKVCLWILDLLNMQKEDTLIDVFPGTGAMGRAFDIRFARPEKEAS